MTRYGSRKFVLAMLTLGACVWSLSEGLIDADVFRTIILGTVGAYIVGNVAQKAWVKDGQVTQ